jgi:DNA-binding Xre family transcriptional regulator
MDEWKCHCGKLFTHRQSLYRHKRTCGRKNIIITEPAEPEHNLPQIEYYQTEPDHNSDESAEFRGDDASDEVPYYNKPSEEKKPFFNSKVEEKDKEHSPRRFPNNYIDLSKETYNFDTCDHLRKQIEQLLLTNDMENAELAGKLVLEDRKLYENYVNNKLNSLLAERETVFCRRKELEREMGITPMQYEQINYEVNNITSMNDLERLCKFHKYYFEHLLYEMRFNEKFVKTIPALKIMKENVENFKNLNVKRDFVKTGLDPVKVNEMIYHTETKTASKIQKKFIFFICCIVMFIFFLLVLLQYFKGTQILLLLFFAFLLYLIYYVKKYFIDDDKKFY